MVRIFPKISKTGRYRLCQGVAVATVVAGHALVLALLCWRPPVLESADSSVDGPVVLASLVEAAPPAARRASKAESRTPPVVAPDPEAVQTDPVPADAADNAPQLSDTDAAALDAFQPILAAGAPGTPCNLTGMIAGLLATSPEVRHGLAEMPPSQRSVANAVNMWDGQWPQDSTSGGKGLLRAILAKAVAAARPDCLTVPNHGPALFFIPEDRTTVVVAVGSGEWRWGDLVAPPAGVTDNYLDGLASR